MLDLPKAAELAELARLLSPGIIILWIRGRFRDANPPKIGEQIFNFALVSVAYGAATYPLFHADNGVLISSWLWQFLNGFAVPLLIAVAVVFFDRTERFYKFADKLGLHVAHHAPTAWDYNFHNQKVAYVLVHLTDGSTVAGAWADGSCSSSTPGDRDLLISQLWKLNEDGSWELVEPQRSMLICGGNIRMIEFIQGGQE